MLARKSEKELALRSSAAEYLTFVAANGESDVSFEMRYENENIWLTQKMMATLYDVSVAAINQHLKRVFEDGELREESVIKKYLRLPLIIVPNPATSSPLTKISRKSAIQTHCLHAK